MTTAVVQIGNSDDKLPQAAWAAFVTSAWSVCDYIGAQIHFGGFSPPAAPWQNACWVFEIDDENVDLLRARLAECAAKYRQSSIALTVGATEFVPATFADRLNVGEE